MCHRVKIAIIVNNICTNPLCTDTIELFVCLCPGDISVRNGKKTHKRKEDVLFKVSFTCLWSLIQTPPVTIGMSVFLTTKLSWLCENNACQRLNE